jgi:hypothetical protein
MRGWILGIVAAALVGLGIWYFSRNEEQSRAFQERQIATRVLAEYLAKKFPTERVLVISNPFTELGASSDIKDMEKAGINGLREGFGEKVTLKVVLPELKPEARSNPRALLKNPETPTPLSYLVADDALDKLVNANPTFELVVSLIGLPAALDKVQCWQKSGKPSFALLLPDLSFIGDLAEIQTAFKSGKLAAFVSLRQPTTLPQADVPPKFGEHFVLVTADTYSPGPRSLTR